MSNVLTRAATIASAALLATTGALVGATHASAAYKAPTCRLADLELTIGEPQGAAGSVLYPIEFTNTTSRTCSLRGYPGVSVVDAKHRQIGTSAIRTGESYNTVSVFPDDTVTATFRTNSRSVVPDCRQKSAAVKVYPPASGLAEEIPYRLRVCGAFEISPVVPAE
ncbi:DUF4232 domain-containing protein [Streptomyces sp. NBC_00190]|uniref:DUF4232 domain-containing protein n=1 Tax=unclassified Streptomyces TaxID=2593676 RepID=UPI002E2835A8|nr:DUF4232 domain-containing protein [Streptomyces sp. NBC_00190]WSZ41508.1 DUF4232 domain-containing protein [Streptomyces sp. NBC_00868]